MIVWPTQKIARILGGFRHDGDDLASGRDDVGIGAGERMKLEPAIVAPGTAVEADHERALIEQRGKLDELPFAVGQAEIWQRLPDRGHLVARVDIVGDAGDEPIVGRLELGQ